MSIQYVHLHAMAKTSVKYQTVGGVALTSQLLMNGRVTARLYRTCVLTQVRQKKKKKNRANMYEINFMCWKIEAIYRSVIQCMHVNLTLEIAKLNQSKHYFFRENKAWHFMWITCLSDYSHEMSKLVLADKWGKI